MIATASSEVSTAKAVLEQAIATDVPIVAILGQSVSLDPEEKDRLCLEALERRGIEGSSWNEIFDAGRLDSEFFVWLNERYERRSPNKALAKIADAHFSAVFTSSFDPVLKNLFATKGREPEPILIGNPPPPISRSKQRPKIFYLFGLTGAGQFQPPTSRLGLRAHQSQHATPMLNTALEVATPLGLIVVDGFQSGRDWLDPSEILGQLIRAPRKSVLWFGPDPEFSGEDAEIFEELVETSVILRDDRPLGIVIAETQASEDTDKLHAWNEPGIISFDGGKRLVTTASMRLSTEASAAIIDDQWMDVLQPLRSNEQNSFALFHSIPSSIRALFDGVRRGFAIERDFENELYKTVRRAMRNHANEKGAIVVSGQSGIGKSIALYKLAASIREQKIGAVLFARDRIPLAVELGAFLSEVDKLDQVTLLIVDALAAPKRYDTLLESFRSRGHRIVVIGTSYNTELTTHQHDGRLIRVLPNLSDKESERLIALAHKHSPDVVLPEHFSNNAHALGQFFWLLPASRSQISSGLGREARRTERVLRDRGRAQKPVESITSLAHAFLEAGYQPSAPLLNQDTKPNEQEDSAGRLIDYIMACSRVHRWVPINLVLRTLLSDGLAANSQIDTELVRELFEDNDLFRWRYQDNTEDQLLVGARLQLEAQLICDQRLGGPAYEARKIIELISGATRAGPEGSEETRFVAEIVYALGPDGPLGDRYNQSYGEIAEALTSLRKKRGVRNARLMLQEATLRRHFIRRNENQLSEEERLAILDNAREAVEDALADLASNDYSIRAGRRTIENLWVERAATYGFLATSATRNQKSSDIIWAHYIAAREATRNASGKVDTYFPVDISLWTPIQILASATNLGVERETELRADIVSAIEMVDEEDLDPMQLEIFQKQKLRAGDIIGDLELSDEAFNSLEKVGSTVGYYFRAKNTAPERDYTSSKVTDEQLKQAKHTANYLMSIKEKISEDVRCMRLLLNNLWLWKTESWLFNGLRQPIPATDADRSQIMDVLIDLSHASGENLSPKYRYLTAVFGWLIGEETEAIRQFNQLAKDTEYVEAKRVLPRNIIVGEKGNTAEFSGYVEKQIGERRWSLHVRELNRKIDLLEGKWTGEVSIGKEIPRFGIAFNYLGPIADRLQ